MRRPRQASLSDMLMSFTGKSPLLPTDLAKQMIPTKPSALGVTPPAAPQSPPMGVGAFASGGAPYTPPPTPSAPPALWQGQPAVHQRLSQLISQGQPMAPETPQQQPPMHGLEPPDAANAAPPWQTPNDQAWQQARERAEQQLAELEPNQRPGAQYKQAWLQDYYHQHPMLWRPLTGPRAHALEASNSPSGRGLR